MANENEKLWLAGLFNMLAQLVPLFKVAGDPQTAADLEAITARADVNYRDVIITSDQRTGGGS